MNPKRKVPLAYSHAEDSACSLTAIGMTNFGTANLFCGCDASTVRTSKPGGQGAAVLHDLADPTQVS
ncbi:MAG TPA: hypothetical protein VIK39_08950 [Candidatus Angelobacter sp.]